MSPETLAAVAVPSSSLSHTLDLPCFERVNMNEVFTEKIRGYGFFVAFNSKAELHVMARVNYKEKFFELERKP